MIPHTNAKLLLSGGIIAALAALWHLLCIIGGPEWFAFARAPQAIVDSAREGTWLAPLGTVVVAGLMLACTLFALSGAGIIHRMPLLTPALVTIALLCIVRALIALPYLWTPAGADIWQIVASSVWLYVGLCFAAGCRLQFRSASARTAA